MSANELLSYYESTIALDSQILEQDNPVLREYLLEFRCALERRAILRHPRLLRGRTLYYITQGPVHERQTRYMSGARRDLLFVSGVNQRSSYPQQRQRA